MRDYEALVICDAKLEEGDIQKAIDRFSTAITDRGGEVANIDRWGVRRFAYEINHQHEGYYFAVTFKAAVESIAEIEHVINIADEFIRGKITRGAPAAAAPAAPVTTTPVAAAAPAEASAPAAEGSSN
jgi:small subunit ribosomal protein S6